MSKLKDFKSREEFDTAFVPGWVRVDIEKTATALEKKRQQSRVDVPYHIDTGWPRNNHPQHNKKDSIISLKTVGRIS